MSQIQNHGGTKRLYVTSANALTKDKAVSSVKVAIDTSQWSSRKRNIVVKSLRTGVAACGWETAELVEALCQSIDSAVNTISRWKHFVFAHEVRPEKLEELYAYTAAWARMAVAAEKPADPYAHYGYGRHVARRFLSELEDSARPHTIPLNQSMTYDEQREFIHEYLLASQDRQTDELERLIAAIQDGETIFVTYKKAEVAA